ncbi:SgcJ/EcaC family oxidoreductase [Microcoleus sp. LEGE 07076]|uniref:SgcJ/EcaC family oxidoreductase n=1 Tax=Microcoleus sp. LEGE 07076 TaxID=915322 RepID=UPI00187E2FA4|nr:SgcJ/EcaC family oxidoreductase [Microcoleus sp. LEGE 07076]MBE9183224.1 SgcJ/EcaC family oxidoreductase [Microcoleus sp. LEGE 07076]
MKAQVFSLLVTLLLASGCAKQPPTAATSPKPDAANNSQKITTANPEDSKKEVAAATQKWIDTVTSGKPNVVDEVVKLYSPNALLWATVSKQKRDTSQEIRDYFEVFAKLPELKAEGYKPVIRVYDNVAINSGYYTFTYRTKNNKKTVVPARYTFVYAKGNDGKWMIVEHHSSAIPQPPKNLKAAVD